MAKTGRPPVTVDGQKLKALLRLNPTLEDVAAFFECSVDTISRHIRKEHDLTFAEFRDQNMVHTRLNIVRKAVQKAEGGDNVMLIFCLKNLCGWRDRHEVDSKVSVESLQSQLVRAIEGTEKAG